MTRSNKKLSPLMLDASLAVWQTASLARKRAAIRLLERSSFRRDECGGSIGISSNSSSKK
jgi:hypothetical protein